MTEPTKIEILRGHRVPRREPGFAAFRVTFPYVGPRAKRTSSWSHVVYARNEQEAVASAKALHDEAVRRRERPTAEEQLREAKFWATSIARMTGASAAFAIPLTDARRRIDDDVLACARLFTSGRRPWVLIPITRTLLRRILHGRHADLQRVAQVKRSECAVALTLDGVVLLEIVRKN